MIHSVPDAGAPSDAIRITGLVQSFGPITAVNNINLAVPPGSFLVLVGPSGCGKSTLLRMLAGLAAPTAGEIAFMGRVVSSGTGGVVADPRARNTGLVFQSYALWPHMTVAGNIDWPLKVAGWSRADRAARVAEVLGLLDISALRDRYPAEVSGGQQQRVAIARTIAPKPAILLFDEPLSNLDAKLRIEMRSELMRIHRATGATSVYVTHDQVEAMTMATHVAVINKGRIEQFGPPTELLDNPGTTFVATFLGTPPANLLPVTAKGGKLCHGDLPLADAALAGGRAEAQLLYRAQNMTVGPRNNLPSITMQFSEAAPIAGQTMVVGTREDLRLTAMVEGHFSSTPGDLIEMTFLGAPDGVFDNAGERI